jgi:tetratricopeptide (TPR) repeat protein
VDSGARDSSPVYLLRPSSDERLDSWKEIAAYLKRSVRTSRRWEAEEDLPVHRHVHRNSPSVYAFKGELDAWLTRRSSRLAASEPEELRPSNSPDSAATPVSLRLTVRRAVVVVGMLVAAGLAVSNLTSNREETARKVSDADLLLLRSFRAAGAETYDGFQEAIAYCRQAIEKDPAFAAAYARMGVYYLQFSFFGTIAPSEFMPQAEAAANRAIALDETLAEAHAVLGAVQYRFRWDWAASEMEFRRALTLNPNYAEGHRMFSAFLAAVGRADEAVAEARRARELDPRWLQATLNLGMAYRAAGQYDAAIEALRYGLQKDPNRPRAHFQLGNAYLGKGMLRDAIVELERAVVLSKRNPIFLSSLAYAYARTGQRNRARTILAELESLADRQYVAPTAIARMYVGLKDRRSARAWIDKAYRERDIDLVSANADAGLLELRSQSDFRDVFSRVGLVR